MAGAMFFRPIQPRGEVFEAMQHLLALCLLLPVVFVMVMGQLWLASGQILQLGFNALVLLGLQFYSMLLTPMGWGYLAGVLVATLLLHFAFYGSLMTMLDRMKGLSLANLLVGTTVLAAAGAGLLPVLAGYGSTEPRHRLPLLEDFASSFLTYALLLALGALFEWACLRTGPKPPPESPGAAAA
jgi:hypothetical protein